MLVFEERGNMSTRRKTSRSRVATVPTNWAHLWHHVRESNPGHIGGRRALSPLHQHCSPLQCNFVLHCYYLIKYKIHENKENDHQVQCLYDWPESVPTYTIRHILSSVRRIFILVPGLTGLNFRGTYCISELWLILVNVSIWHLAK